MNIDELLKFMVRQGASDLHIKPMRPPLLRIKGRLVPIKTDPLIPDLIKEMLYIILTERQKRFLEDNLYLEFGYSLPGVSRFRTSIYFQRGTLSSVFRRVPIDFPTTDDWGLPEVIKEFAFLPMGLILVTGPTGSGKSSTLASLLKLISDSQPVHIVTIEDPIEFLIRDSLASVTQREVGSDTKSFHDALRNALRQDPDVIMVGEMRDVETMSTVLTAAETGHLVFSTLHTNSAAQTIDRLIDTFPPDQHRQIRQQLSQVLKGVISLNLVERKDGKGLVAAVEIMKATPRIQKLIEEGNIVEIEREMENSVSFLRMQTMNQSLAALVLNAAITLETALSSSISPEDLDLMLRKYLFSKERMTESGGETMVESLSDFSKILELQEIKKLYEEQEEKHRVEMASKNERIAMLEEELSRKASMMSGYEGESSRLREENERLKEQINIIRTELEGKIERLQNRIRELSQQQQEKEGGKGIFRR
ncbi:MAG: PilT/PilU family type 4a pilus ATPase [Acidobacteriota bacterium]